MVSQSLQHAAQLPPKARNEFSRAKPVILLPSFLVRLLTANPSLELDCHASVMVTKSSTDGLILCLG